MSIECVAPADYFGPFDPLSPVGTVETVLDQHEGLRVQRREFEDGWVYEVIVRRGLMFAAMFAAMNVIPKNAVWSEVMNPADLGNMMSRDLHITVWVGKEGAP
ncbi:hypothetical protein [Spirillospora sp. NPDC047279]|uniref:hypothetical protein n=1 Tax=Spirillospora sp. NPDC047279 TaxID=3155478 RepID=UPI0034052FB6